MAEEKQKLVFEATVEGGPSLASLKKEFKELNAELSKADEGTKEYRATLEKLGDVKDQIKDLRENIDALNPGGKLAAFTSVASNLAGGFQAATGAAALFGVKAEDLQATLLKVQAATAFAEGIQSIEGLTRSFEVLKLVIQTNPIFLVAAAIIAAVAAIKLYNDANDKNLLLTKEIIAANELLAASYKETALALDNNIKLASASGQSQINILQLQIEKYDQLEKSLSAQADNQARLSLTLKQGSEEQIAATNKANELSAQATAAAYEGAAAILQIEKIQSDKAKDDAKKALDAFLAAQKERISNMQDYLAKKAALEEEYATASLVADQKMREAETAQAVAQIAEENRIEQIERDYEDERIRKQMAENKARDEQDKAESVALAQRTEQAKVAAVDTSLQASQALSEAYFAWQLNGVVKGSEAELKIKKKAFEVNKAFAIADTIINGVRAVQQALTNPYPLNLVLAAASGILAAANVAKIAATKFDSGSTSAPAIGGGGGSIPNIPIASSQSQTRLNADGTAQQNGGQPTRAYIVYDDIADSTERMKRIEKQGTY